VFVRVISWIASFAAKRMIHEINEQNTKTNRLNVVSPSSQGGDKLKVIGHQE